MIFNFSNTGTYYYDWESKSVRIDRKHSSGDRYCMGVNPITFARCTHLVDQGTRYLIYDYEEWQTCCKCCMDYNGCGILKPTWADEGVFEDTYVREDGVQVDMFKVRGYHSNYYYYVTRDGKPARLNMLPNDDMQFDTNTYGDITYKEDVFKLPKVCKVAKMCGGICAIARLNYANENVCKAHYCRNKTEKNEVSDRMDINNDKL